MHVSPEFKALRNILCYRFIIVINLSYKLKYTVFLHKRTTLKFINTTIYNRGPH